MELPFAVESSSGPSSSMPHHNHHHQNQNGSSSSSLLHQSDSSLVTASSQGSFMNSATLDSGGSNSPLLPNTPQDVVLPRYDNLHHQHHHHLQQQQQQQHGGHLLLSPAQQQGIGGGNSRLHGQQQQQQHQQQHGILEHDVIDFTYVDVCETDEDEVTILIEGLGTNGTTLQQETQRGDVLAVILSGVQQGENETLMKQMETANEAATKASEAKKNGDLMDALEYHSQAAKMYRNLGVTLRERNVSLSTTMFLLSQTQAKSALALKNIVKLSPLELEQVLPSSSSSNAAGRGGTATTTTSATANSSSSSSSPYGTSAPITQKDRLRAAVRGALGSKHPHEADLSESQFLGSVTATTNGQSTSTTATAGAANSGIKSMNNNSIDDGRDTHASIIDDNDDRNDDDEKGTLLSDGHDSGHNPVDEMMELERELRDMDMALELGNSISSLDARMQHRMKNSIVDGSFMVVPPGSNSYMSSSAMWGSTHVTPSSNQRPPPPQTNSSGTAGVRARANRVQNKLGASTTHVNNNHQHRHHLPPVLSPTIGGTTANNINNNNNNNNNITAPVPKSTTTNAGLESSWWGNASTASQILTSSVISLGSRAGIADMGHGGGGGGGGGISSNEANQQQHQANTKQLMRLMDSLKTLNDENTALLREVEEAEVARQEAKAAREQMKRFKAEYGKRFSALKAALEKFRQEHPEGNASGGANPVASSEFSKKASVADQLQRQEQLIRKLTLDLKKEKEESKKKDAALRKYESFYREVKARSAQKAAQRQMENQQRQQKTRQQQHHSLSSRTPIR